MKIARVFPTRTNMTPIDADAYYGLPDLFMPDYNEIHISVLFTWDIPKAKRLAEEWAPYGEVKLGGPAMNSPADEFIPGLYLRKGCTITSRGCPNKCSFCFVPKREGNLKELEVMDGNVILDNNLTACSKSHLDKVFKMLSHQKQVSFNGGLEARRITSDFVDRIKGLPSVKDIWLAFDHAGAEETVRKAFSLLRKYFNRNKLRCYNLIGYKDDTIKKAEQRLMSTYRMGALPFAMLYKDEHNTLQTKEWRRFQRIWCRPAAYKSIMSKED